ncbi:hypothetical protein M892_27455 [Vibrio campbellii ATCC BAA-1116]|nr:hypothetical protein M892_27455 [Vibrio campbellii ATCC BAA-1116]
MRFNTNKYPKKNGALSAVFSTILLYPLKPSNISPHTAGDKDH